jgi:hypothetical protein
MSIDRIPDDRISDDELTDEQILDNIAPEKIVAKAYAIQQAKKTQDRKNKLAELDESYKLEAVKQYGYLKFQYEWPMIYESVILEDVDYHGDDYYTVEGYLLESSLSDVLEKIGEGQTVRLSIELLEPRFDTLGWKEHLSNKYKLDQ